MKSLLNDIDRLLIGAGIGLLLGGAYLTYPYLHSRLAGPAPVPPQTSSVSVGGTRTEKRVATVYASTAQPTETVSVTRVDGTDRDVRPTPSDEDETITLPKAGAPGPDTERAAGRPPTRIVVPALQIDAPVVPVSVEEKEIAGEVQKIWGVPDDFAAGWHDTSARVGERGNTVLNGHNTNHGEIFRDLYRLRPNDEIVLHTKEISATYRVSETLILAEGGQPLEVRLRNARYVLPTDDTRLTLVTCHPYGSLRDRLIVIARPVQPGIGSTPPEN